MIENKIVKRNQYKITKIHNKSKRISKIRNNVNGKNEHLYYQSFTIQFKKKEKYARNVNIKIHFLDKIVKNVTLNMEAKQEMREILSNKICTLEYSIQDKVILSTR
jgi:hypothetical protein